MKRTIPLHVARIAHHFRCSGGSNEVWHFSVYSYLRRVHGLELKLGEGRLRGRSERGWDWQGFASCKTKRIALISLWSNRIALMSVSERKAIFTEVQRISLVSAVNGSVKDFSHHKSL